MGDVQRRVVDHLHDLHERHPDGAVVLTTHAEIIRAALLHWLDASLDEYWRHEITPASCTTLSLEGSHLSVHAVSALSPILRCSTGEDSVGGAAAELPP